MLNVGEIEGNTIEKILTVRNQNNWIDYLLNYGKITLAWRMFILLLTKESFFTC
jgi:hypothetical protein